MGRFPEAVGYIVKIGGQYVYVWDVGDPFHVDELIDNYGPFAIQVYSNLPQCICTNTYITTVIIIVCLRIFEHHTKIPPKVLSFQIFSHV